MTDQDWVKDCSDDSSLVYFCFLANLLDLLHSLLLWFLVISNILVKLTFILKRLVRQHPSV